MSVKQVETVDISYFYKENKKETESINYIASENFCDQDGNPIPWKIRPVTAKEEDTIRRNCTDRKTDRRTGVINETFDDTRYAQALTVQGIEFPNLFDKGLQKTYGVNSATGVLQEMLTSGEFQSLALKVIEVSGLSDIEDSVKENEFKTELAKNN